MIWNSRWYGLRQDQVRFPDGSEGTYTIVDKRDAVWIIPILSDGRIVLIRNYRYTIKEWVWEIPAGGIEDGVTPAEMAHRELAEEIGGTSERIEQVADFYTALGICNERAYIFVAHNVVLGEPHHEPSEITERHLFPREEVIAMIYRGEIADGPSALAILLSLPHLGGMTAGVSSSSDE